MNLVDVDSDDARLLRLLQLYIHEWTALLPSLAMPNADGSFTYANLDQLRAVLFLDDALPIGFALTRVDEDGVAHVEEFFVLAGLRRRGIGALAATKLFAREQAWTLTVRPENPRALSFWRSVTSSYPDRREAIEMREDGVARTRISFRVNLRA